MNLIDHLLSQPFHRDYYDSCLVLFGQAEIQMAIGFGIVKHDSIGIYLNIQ